MSITLEAGDIVYCKGVARFGTTGSLEFRAGRHEHYICVLLGINEDRKKLPTEKECMALATSIGLLNLDDIEECLGAEAARQITEFAINKYYPHENPTTPDATKTP